MPDEEQIQSVVAEIERLQAERPDGRTWDAMTYGERYAALGEIEWAGFSREDELRVIGRIMANEPPELWMGGIDGHDDDPLPSPDERKALFDEIRQDEHAARVRDYGEADAATYADRVGAGADSVRYLESSAPFVGPEEVERLLDELERGWGARSREELFRLPEASPPHIGNRTEGIIVRMEDVGNMVTDGDTPLAHVERQVQEVKRATVNSSRQIVGPWSELGDAARLRELEREVEWSLISDRQKESLLAREVDFSKITRDQLNAVYEDLGSYDIDVDERPGRRLFDEANYARAVAEADKTPFAEQLAHARDTTRNLVEAIRADEWPRNAAIVDFGIDSQEHYEALYYPIRNGEIAPAVLDAAMGHGAKLTELARDAPSNPHKEVTFHTSWDELLGRQRPEDGDRNPPGGAAPAQQSPDKPAASDYARTLDDTARRAQQRDPDRGIDR